MQTYRKLIITLISLTLTCMGCVEQYALGDFEVDETLVPEQNTNPPNAPTGLVVSYNDFCDRVELSWDSVPRANSYSIYIGETVIAEKITETAFTYSDAPAIETEYRVYANNNNGSSSDFTTGVGKRGAIPETPTHFTASKGTSESVVLTWDEAEHAQYYQLLVEGTLLADSIATTFYIDEKGSMTMTKYSLKAYSFCGESEWVSDSGRIGVASELVDNLDNLDYTSISINMEILTNNPAGFGGDGGRIARSAPELAELIYNYAGLTDFSIDLWIVTEQGITSDFKVYTSTDGSTYSEIPTSQVTQNLGYRSLITFHPDGAMVDVNYLKVEMSGSDAVWKDQIGKVVLKYSN